MVVFTPLRGFSRSTYLRLWTETAWRKSKDCLVVITSPEFVFVEILLKPGRSQKPDTSVKLLLGS
jgi:hypothetical protein